MSRVNCFDNIRHSVPVIACGFLANINEGEAVPHRLLHGHIVSFRLYNGTVGAAQNAR